MKLKTEVLYLPRPATKYPGCYPLHFEKHIKKYLQTNNYLHLFSGSATSGYTVDINPNCNPKTVANAEELPFEDNTFKGAFADPPYTPEFAKELYNCEYPKWSKWTRELVRVVKNGSRIGIMQNYIVPKLPQCKYIKIIIILLRIKQYPKIITLQEKLTTLEEFK
ncbi:MAG: hypothetical protein ACFFG0_04940 [Candidatus Thorarchaeota archaeon]